MKFSVTAVLLEDCYESIDTACVRIEDWLTASLSDGSFGDELDQVVFVVVATEDDPSENLARAAGFDKLGKYTGMIDSLPVRHLSFGLSLPYNSAVALTPQEATEAIALLILEKLTVRPKRLPKGFDFPKLSNAISAATKAFTPAA